MRRSHLVTLLCVAVIAIGGLTGTLLAGWSPVLGLDLQGGASVVLQPKEQVDSGVLDQSISIIRNRVDALGVAEPDISRQGQSIIVQLPGVKDQDRALALVGQTAELRFRPVLGELPASETEIPTTTTTPTTTAPEGTTTTAEGATTTAPATTVAPTTTTAPPAGGVPTTPREEDDPEKEVVLPLVDDGETVLRYRLGPAVATGKILRTARAEVNPTNGRWQVQFQTTSAGSREFGDLTTQFTGQQLAIVLDGVVQSAPVINEPITGGEGQITGNFNEREAKDLALVLKYGALPVELEQATVQTVSASLGNDSLRAGIAAGIVGLSLVLLYMLLYYRALGIVVILGLTVWGTLQFTIISYLGETRGLALTLAGATGLIVSVGVTVDSYVVYFERLKDEIRSGKTIRSSVDRGFNRAYRTIVTADVSAFIGAALLYWLTVGPVRGFAFYLGLSTLLDLLIAYFFTRPLVALVSRNRLFTEARWFGVARGLAARPAGGVA